MEENMKIGAIVWGVKDIKKSVAFWSQALDYTTAYEPGEDFAMLIPKTGEGITLSFNRETSDKARRHHMDIYSSSPKEDIERLLNLGATLAKWNYHEGEDYTVLKDPEGNPFCIIPGEE